MKGEDYEADFQYLLRKIAATWDWEFVERIRESYGAVWLEFKTPLPFLVSCQQQGENYFPYRFVFQGRAWAYNCVITDVNHPTLVVKHTNSFGNEQMMVEDIMAGKLAL